MTRITYRRAWCDDCFDDCYWSYDETTGITKHVGSGTLALAAALEPLRRQGAYVRHLGHGDFQATLYKAGPIALTLDWQMAIQLADQRETIDQDQDW